MLCISMKAGDYFTVGSSTVVQFERLNGERIHLTINAPREVPILRGDVLERGGNSRPACVKEVSPRYVRQLPWNHEKKRALAEMLETLNQMEDSPEVQRLRENLSRIFPRAQENAAAKTAV